MVVKGVAYHIVRDLAGENPENMKPLITNVSSACYYYPLAQDVIRWPFTAQASSCGIYGDKMALVHWVFLFQFYSTKLIHLPPTL
jgi:hypothetical protein